MHEALQRRLEGIQNILMAHHAAGAKLPSASKGNEREILVREFLAKVLPPPFRFGSGAIVDSAGRCTGQLDIVVEFPFLPSFPTPGAPERLYLADSVAFVIEVKSDLSAQWSQVEQKASQLAPLRRNWAGHLHFGAHGLPVNASRSESQIPLIAVGFEGFASSASLQTKVSATTALDRVHGAAVLRTGAYACTVAGATSAADGTAGLFALCSDAAYFARNVMIAQPDLSGFLTQ